MGTECQRKEDGARILPHGTGPTRRAPRTLDPFNRGVGEAEEPVRNQVFSLDANTQKEEHRCREKELLVLLSLFSELL